MSNQLTGVLREKYDAVRVSEKFIKRDMVITTDGQYPQHITMQLTQDRCEALDKFNVGDTVTAHYNLRGKQYEKDGAVKYFNTIECWKLEGTNTPTSSNHDDDLGF